MNAILWLALTACAETEGNVESAFDYLEEGDFVIEDSHVNIFKSFEFFGMDENGFADGINLDGIVSENGDEETCGHEDLTNADGETGIDNQFGKLWNTIGPVLGAGTGLLQGAINEGRVLIAIEFKDLDDLYNDDDVTLSVFPVVGDPFIGALGTIAPDQTYYVHPDTPLSTVTGVEIVNGQFTGGPFEFIMPISILEAEFDTVVRKAQVKGSIDEDGQIDGIMGFGLDVDQVLDEALQTDAAEEFEAVEPIFRFNADMENNGDECEQFSVGWRFNGASGFVVRSEQVEAGK